MKSAFIVLSSFLLFAAVHGSALLETRANDQGKDQGKGSGSPNGQGGNGTFVIPSSCTNGASPQGTGVPVTPPTNQTSNGAPPPQCFNLTASDPTSGDQPSFVVQFNNSSSSAQGNPPPSNQTSSNGDNNGSSGDPHFQFCPSSDGSSTPPFANGTTIQYQEVPCPNSGDQTNGAPPANGTDPSSSTPPAGTNGTDPSKAGSDGKGNGNDKH
ncbi:hypothetical protein V8E53_012571 [Lactarius tabidus]